MCPPRFFAPLGPAPRTSTAKPTACTVGCELARHNGSFLGVTAESGFWHPATAAYRTPIGFADTATPCFPTGLTLGTRATTVCGGSGKSARLHRRMGHICFDFWTTRAHPSFLFQRRPARRRRELCEVLGVYIYTWLRSAFARGGQRNVDEFRGVAMDSRFLLLGCSRYIYIYWSFS